MAAAKLPIVRSIDATTKPTWWNVPTGIQQRDSGSSESCGSVVIVSLARRRSRLRGDAVQPADQMLALVEERARFVANRREQPVLRFVEPRDDVRLDAVLFF